MILRHVLEHIPNPYGFLSMLKSVLKHQNLYRGAELGLIVEYKTFFDITYEHVNYFSELSLRKLFNEAGLIYGVLFDNQYQYVIAELGDLNVQFKELFQGENWKYVSFSELFPNLMTDIKRIDDFVQGRFVWGAATKGCLFLAHCSKANRLIDKTAFAIDQNPKKVGRYLPGSGVQIKSKEEFFHCAKQDDVLLIVNPAYKGEITSEVRAAGLHDIKIETL